MGTQNKPNIPPEELYRQPGALPAKKNWFALHHLLAYLLFGLLATLAVVGTYYYQVVQFNSSFYQAPVHHPKSSDSTTDWNTYTNTEYGFEFKYPSDFLVKDSKDISDSRYPLVVYNLKQTIDPDYPEHTPLDIYAIRTNSSKCISAKEYLQSQDTDPENNLGVSITDIGTPEGIDLSVDAWEGQESGGEKLGIVTTGVYLTSKKCLLVNGKQLFILFSENGTDEIFYQILSTFKFIDNDTIACIQVITRAKNKTTGEIKDFPTPCDIPTDWQIMGPASALK